jgi:hypothetical protein
MLFVMLTSSVFSTLLAWAAGQDLDVDFGSVQLNDCGRVSIDYYNQWENEQYRIPFSYNDTWRSGLPVTLLALGPLFLAICTFLVLHEEFVSQMLGILRGLGLRESVYWAVGLFSPSVMHHVVHGSRFLILFCLSELVDFLSPHYVSELAVGCHLRQAPHRSCLFAYVPCWNHGKLVLFECRPSRFRFLSSSGLQYISTRCTVAHFHHDSRRLGSFPCASFQISVPVSFRRCARVSIHANRSLLDPRKYNCLQPKLCQRDHHRLQRLPEPHHEPGTRRVVQVGSRTGTRDAGRIFCWLLWGRRLLKHTL